MMSNDRITASCILGYLSRALRIYSDQKLGKIKSRKLVGKVLTIKFEELTVRIDWGRDDEFEVQLEDRNGNKVTDFHAFRAGGVERDEPTAAIFQAAQERRKLKALDL